MKASEARHLSDMIIKSRDDEREKMLTKNFSSVFAAIRGSLIKQYVEVSIAPEQAKDFGWLMDRLGYKTAVTNPKAGNALIIDIRW